MKRKKNKENYEDKGNRIEFSMLSASDLLDITKKISNENSGICSYEELAKITTGSKKTKGGAFARVIKGLKLYDLMVREGMSEMKITSYGKNIVNLPEEKQKTTLFQKFLEIPIYNELYKKYESAGVLPIKRKPVAEALAKQKSIDRRTAGRIIGMFYKEFEYFKDVMGKTLPPKILPSKGNVNPDSHLKLGDYAAISDIVNLTTKLFPRESEDAMVDLIELKRLSQEKNLTSFATLIDILLVTLQNKTKEEINVELKKFSELAMAKLQEDLNG